MYSTSTRISRAESLAAYHLHYHPIQLLIPVVCWWEYLFTKPVRRLSNNRNTCVKSACGNLWCEGFVAKPGGIASAAPISVFD
jgi:hypothetical protein